MKFSHSRWRVILFVVSALLAASLFPVACGGPAPTPEVIYITATFTPGSVVRVVTATFTPTPPVLATDTLPPPPPPTSQSGAGLGQLEQPTVTQTAAQATDTAVPQPTETPVPSPTQTSTPKPTAQSQTSLKSYFVVYTAYKGPDIQGYSLWGMNGDGSEAFHIGGAGQASEPAFSADGKQFAFYHWSDGIYVWDLKKQTSRQIVHDGNSSFPTWSPNGQRLAYFQAAGQRWIYLVNADGSGAQQFTPGMRPYWSLQGGFIAYDTCENNKCGIFRINPDGKGKRQLTSDSGGGAAVSPDGKRIAYWSQADGDFEIYVINADGSGKKQLTKNSGNDALPAWSPDGKYIYYLGDQNGKGWAVMVMNADGSNPRKIIATSAGTDPARGWQYQRITVTWNQ
jgi:TolB protein